LLSRLNISIGELMMHFVTKDEKVKLELDKAMGSLFNTFMSNPHQLSKIAELAESESELFIAEMEERIETREQIRRNQFMGALVEDLLKSVLEKEGFKVEKIRVGSDFLIEYDCVKDNAETVFEIKKENKAYYIELKSTTQDYVKMTLPQAKEARDNPDNHVLCVIEVDNSQPNEESIKKSARFVTDIGSKIQDKVDEAENIKEEQEKIASSGDIEIVINEGPIRIKINKPIWKDSKTFDEFFAFLQEL